MNFYTFQKIGLDDNLLAKIKGEYDGRVRTLEKLGYIKHGKLTEIGLFTTKIYSNELELSQIFNSNFELDEYKIMLLISALSYEERREIVFHQLYRSKEVSELIHLIKNHPFLKKDMFWRDIEKMTGIIHPIMQRKTFIEILKNTNMVEGDLMRLLMQTLDRLEQVDRAVDDHEISAKVRNCKHLIRDSLEGIGVF
jgi:superfamily II RNA helicase